MDSLKGKVVLITGASSGIGAGTAVYLAKLGCRLGLTGRNHENLQKVQKECIDVGLKPDQVMTVLGSIENTADCERIVQTTVDKFGQLDVLVNNAALAIRGTMDSLTVEEFDQQLNINVRSVFQLSKFATPHLAKTKGNIVNISSLVGVRPVVNSLAYSTSKAAVDHLSRNMALDLASKGIRVNAVNPGLIVTEFQKRAGMKEDAYQALLKNMAVMFPVKRLGLPEDVAKAIAFLASYMASFITGEQIFVDGGAHLGSMSISNEKSTN